MVYKVVQNSMGYFEIENKPSENELQEYYAKKYYQEESSLYQKEYSAQDLTYLKNKLAQKEFVLKKLMQQDLNGKSFLDIGCGEGYALKYFEKRGMHVTGIDYSNHGVQVQNKDQLGNLKTGEIIGKLKELIQNKVKYHVILMDNILEHLLDPGNVLGLVHDLLNDKGILMIEVPNDFSELQEDLMERELVDHQFWVAPPDHVSYFNYTSLNELCKVKGFNKLKAVADFPIDLNLLDLNSNYIKNKELGKPLHNKRVLIENYLNDVDMESLINIYTILAQMGIGRNVLSYFEKTK